MNERIAVIGLGYVGLPVALGFADHAPTVGFDIDNQRVEQLTRGHDRTLEVTRERLLGSSCRFSADRSLRSPGIRAFIKPCGSTSGLYRMPASKLLRRSFMPLRLYRRAAGLAGENASNAPYTNSIIPRPTPIMRMMLPPLSTAGKRLKNHSCMINPP